MFFGKKKPQQTPSSSEHTSEGYPIFPPQTSAEDPYENGWFDDEHESMPESTLSLEEVIALLRQLQGSRPEYNDSGYEVFYSPEARQELYKIGKGIAEYARSNDIGTVCFMDRSARPAYVAMTTYWNKAYPAAEKPDIRFLNPKGFVSQEDILRGDVDLQELMVNDFYKQGDIEDIENIRSERLIDWELDDIIDKSEKRDKPVLLFDACVHSGATLLPVIEKLVDAGVDDLRIGTVSDSDMQINLPLDLKILENEPDRVCYPFGRDKLTNKAYGSVISESKILTPKEQKEAGLIRKEIKRAVEEVWVAEHQ